MPSKKEEPTTILYMAKDNQNPYVNIFKDELEEQGYNVKDVDWPLILPLTRTALGTSGNDIMQLDWLYRFYITDGYTGYKIIDIISTIGRSVALLVDLLLINFLSTSVVWTIHNKSHHEKKYPHVERVINETTLWVADATTVKCKTAQDILSHTYLKFNKNKSYIVPDGNYISVYQNEITKKQAREKLSIDESKFVYLFFGSVREYKGVKELIDSYNQIDEKDTELWIVGNPKYREFGNEIETLSYRSDGIYTRLEFIPQDEVQIYLNVADVLVLPYRDILNSGSVLLGMSFELPIVAPKIGCIPETISNHNEFLYEYNEESALEQELRKVYEKEDLKAIGEANYSKVQKQNWELAICEMATIYNNV